MGRLSLAFRIFFRTLFNRDAALQVASIFDNTLSQKSIETPPSPSLSPASAASSKKAPPTRSEALTLLEALQREARFIDLCHESLEVYSDEQIGAAARNVIRDASQVLSRYFAMKPLADQAEGATLAVPGGFDPGRFRLTGNVSGSPPWQGRITHTGWQATKCELPQWTGSAAASLVVAPVEVEVT